MPELNLYAIVQRTPKADDDAEKDHLRVRIYRSAEEVVKDAAVDVVVVTTTPDSHYRFTNEALENGKHGMKHVWTSMFIRCPKVDFKKILVVVEKPFTPTFAEAEELIAVARRKKRLLTVYQSKAFPTRQLVLHHKLHETKIAGGMRTSSPYRI